MFCSLRSPVVLVRILTWEFGETWRPESSCDLWALNSFRMFKLLGFFFISITDCKANYYLTKKNPCQTNKLTSFVLQPNWLFLLRIIVDYQVVELRLKINGWDTAGETIKMVIHNLTWSEIRMTSILKPKCLRSPFSYS